MVPQRLIEVKGGWSGERGSGVYTYIEKSRRENKGVREYRGMGPPRYPAPRSTYTQRGGNRMTGQRQHLVYETPTGFACRWCSMWARIRSLFSVLSCPPPGGR